MGSPCLPPPALELFSTDLKRIMLYQPLFSAYVTCSIYLPDLDLLDTMHDCGRGGDFTGM